MNSTAAKLQIKEAGPGDLPGLLELYTHLHSNALPTVDAALLALWEGMVADENHHILLGCVGGAVVSSCVVLVVPNLTHGQRPYALVENVVTHSSWRGRGYARQVLDAAKGIALAQNCYKMMLMTGAKDAATLRFYERAGYNRQDKTGFVQWLA